MKFTLTNQNSTIEALKYFNGFHDSSLSKINLDVGFIESNYTGPDYPEDYSCVIELLHNNYEDKAESKDQVVTVFFKSVTSLSIENFPGSDNLFFEIKIQEIESGLHFSIDSKIAIVCKSIEIYDI